MQRRLAIFATIDRGPDRSPTCCRLIELHDNGARIAVSEPSFLGEKFTLIFSKELQRRCEVISLRTDDLVVRIIE
jgi:hypothetical protein